jgi:hypothetical protein
MKPENSTWLQTTNHLKYYIYHIHYSNLACLNSLKIDYKAHLPTKFYALHSNKKLCY